MDTKLFCLLDQKLVKKEFIFNIGNYLQLLNSLNGFPAKKRNLHKHVLSRYKIGLRNLKEEFIHKIVLDTKKRSINMPLLLILLKK
jgi:ribosome-associated toxin RatA of RatAB toxin-antitoxin module